MNALGLIRLTGQSAVLMRLPWFTRLSEPGERPTRVRFVLAFAALVVGWAVLHDLWLIRVEPRHFTEFHRPLLPISDLNLLAVQYAVFATLGPGLAFGFLAHAACRGGDRPPARLVTVLAGFAVLMVAVEVVLQLLGYWSLARFKAGGDPLYPGLLYPELSDGIVFSQTVNVSAYALAPLCGAFYLLAVWRWRRRRALDYYDKVGAGNSSAGVTSINKA
ncbi:MAG: hypothetical protein ABII82_15320 [Verrucomicrobiota bacterium]